MKRQRSLRQFIRVLPQKGFTLLEIILVLALIGVIATVIIPNLRLSIDSKMRVSIGNLTAQMRAAYDSAIFSGQLQRMVFDIKTGEFWTEGAPLGYDGRPPSVEDNDNSTSSTLADNLKTFLETLNQEEKNFSSRSTSLVSEVTNVTYTIRNIPVVQKKVLLPIQWKELNDAISFKQFLPKGIVIAQFFSNLTANVLDYATANLEKNKNKKYYGYIYFLPDGTTTGASIRIATKKESEINNNSINDDGEKYTLNLNTLTGQTHLLKGFQSANFTLLKR